MLARIPAPLFLEWMAYSRVEPFGEERADWRNANLMALVAMGLGAKNVKPADFMWRTATKAQSSRRQTPEEMWAILGAVAKVQNKIVERKAGAKK
jgi:hypothetical protein